VQAVPDLERIEELFANFNGLLRLDPARCEQLLRDAQPHIDRLHAAQVTQRLRETLDFNIFAITNRANYEVTTHSAFLVHLLDPLAEHRQGNLFLSRFLNFLQHQMPHGRALFLTAGGASVKKATVSI
jgi:PD-(D/E)XK nuclease superfamily